jgi:hypothetical protein
MGFGDFLFGSEGSPGEAGLLYAKDYGDYAGIRADLIDYAQGIMAGKEPEFFNTYIPQIERHQEQALNRYYLGDPGYRSSSAMNLAAQTGAITGVGPKATVAQQGRVANELAAKKAAAQNAMNKYRLNWMGQGQWNAQNNLLQLPQGQRAFPYQIQPQSGSPGFLQQALGAMTGIGIGNMMGGKSFFGGADGGADGGGLFPSTTTATTGNTDLGYGGWGASPGSGVASGAGRGFPTFN